jgi:hypothetical protein
MALKSERAAAVLKFIDVGYKSPNPYLYPNQNGFKTVASVFNNDT